MQHFVFNQKKNPPNEGFISSTFQYYLKTRERIMENPSPYTGRYQVVILITDPSTIQSRPFQYTFLGNEYRINGTQIRGL